MSTGLPDPGDESSVADLHCAVVVRNANLYLSRETCERHFAGLSSVALIVREDRVLIVPLATGGSGLLLKTRNARGDRVISAQTLFREQGYDESDESLTIGACWSAQQGALILDPIPKSGDYLQT